MGLGLDVAALETVERTFAERGAKPTIELPTLAEPGLVEALGEAGYRARGFEDVLVRSTAGEATTLPKGVVLETVPDAGLEDWLDVLVEGCAHPDEEGPVAVESFPREAVRTAVRAMTASSTRVLARREGVPAGAASLSIARLEAQAERFAARVHDALHPGALRPPVTQAITAQNNAIAAGAHDGRAASQSPLDICTVPR